MTHHYTILRKEQPIPDGVVTIYYEFGFGEQGSISVPGRMAESDRIDGIIQRQLAKRAEIKEQLAAGGD